MFVTFFDTCMVTLVAILVWRFHPLLVALPFLFFASVDGLFLSSALNKVPDGAWFTITVASLLAALFLLWRFGKENQWRAEAEDRIKAHQLLAADAAGQLHLAPRFGGDGLASIRGFGVFFDKTGVLTPAVFTHFVRKLNAVPDVMVFFHLHPVDTPSVPGTERYAVTRFPSIPGCYRLVIRHGFMDEVVSPDLAALIYEQVRTFVIRQAAAREEEEEEEEEQVEEAELETVQPGADAGHGPVREKDGPVETTSAAGPEFGQQQPQQEEEEEHGHRGAGSETTTTTTTAASPAPADSSTGGAATKRPAAAALRDAKTAAELARLDRAFAAKILYVVGKEQMHVRAATGLPRRVLLSVFLWIRENTRAKIGNLRLAMERVVEVGFVKEI